MLENVKGIVLKTVKFSDAKLIVDLFTLSHGRMSFVTNITHSRMGRSQMAFWSPLSLLEFQADIRPVSSSMPKPKDVRLYYNYGDIPYNSFKSTICLFLAEFLSASLKGAMADEPLYLYLETSFQYLDNLTEPSSIANFHLVFLLRLTRFLGILPNLDLPSDAPHNASPIFDLQSATYTYSVPTHRHCLSIEESSVLPLLYRIDFSTMHLLHLTRAQRSRLLEVLNLYYSLHIPSFPELKSLGVLHEIFS